MRGTLILLVLVATACKDKSPPPAPAPVAEATKPGPAPSAKSSSPGPAPVLPAADAPLPPQSTPEQRFATETTADSPWRAKTEETLKRRLATLPSGAPSSIECHETVCAITLQKPQPKDLDALTQLRDIARSVTLSRPDATSVRAYLQFERDDR